MSSYRHFCLTVVVAILSLPHHLGQSLIASSRRPLVIVVISAVSRHLVYPAASWEPMSNVPTRQPPCLLVIITLVGID